VEVLLELLNLLTSELYLQSHVHFAGFVERPVEALSGYDAMVFPSRREGLPLGLLEEMAAGCIAIVAPH
jgi:glycosyltransferase involved in cell wall biosynthesis